MQREPKTETLLNCNLLAAVTAGEFNVAAKMNIYLLTLRGYLSWVISNKHIIVHLLLRHKK